MEPNVKETLAANVLALREHHGWSQTELEKRSGVKQTTISAVERAVHAATIDTLSGLAYAFRVSPWSLLIPGVSPANHRTGASKLLEVYVQLPDSGREQLDRVADAESRYHAIRR